MESAKAAAYLDARSKWWISGRKSARTTARAQTARYHSKWAMRVATWNINSVRRRLPLLLDWLAANQPDVLCLQETKVQDDDFPASVFRDVGYYSSFRGMKGYNGVATLSRREPQSVTHGLCAGPDSEDVRILEAVIAGLPIVNTYVPQGFRVGTDKYAFKLEWFHRLRRYFTEKLDPMKPAIWLGDLNVAPEPIDVYHPDRRVKRSRLPRRRARRLSSRRQLGILREGRRHRLDPFGEGHERNYDGFKTFCNCGIFPAIYGHRAGGYRFYIPFQRGRKSVVLCAATSIEKIDLKKSPSELEMVNLPHNSHKTLVHTPVRAQRFCKA
jgi:exodeoxyribonuclease III